MKKVQIVDAHHHFWDLSENYYPWLQDTEEKHFFLGDYTELKKDYLPQDYLKDASDYDVLATVHVEAEWDRNDQVGETEWLQRINKTCGMPNAIVGHVWLSADNCEEVLYKHSQFELFRGVRSKPETAMTSDHTKPTGAGSMHDPNWRNGIAILEQMQLSYDLRVPYWHLYEAADVLGPHTNLKVVLNHTGFPWDRSKNGIKAWRLAMKAVAACPNICVKISELGLKDSPWTVDNNRQVILDTIDIFGVERCMWASNFPVAGLKVSYKDQLDGMFKIMSGLPDYNLQKIFFRNAIDFYKIDIPSNY